MVIERARIVPFLRWRSIQVPLLLFNDRRCSFNWE
jgi:hypothetical protein